MESAEYTEKGDGWIGEESELPAKHADKNERRAERAGERGKMRGKTKIGRAGGGLEAISREGGGSEGGHGGTCGV